MIRLVIGFGMLCVLPSQLLAHAMSKADQQRMLEAGYGEYVWLGAKHMLTGYDHLLFLFGVIFFLTNLKDVFKYVTVFTAGHCITLLYATFFGLQANVYLVDAVIALTVIYKGFDNLDGFRRFLDVKAPPLTAMILVFGLIHGFGLSTRLQQLPLGEDMGGVVMRILSFNVGVELGQVVALSVMWLLLSGWRWSDTFKKFSMAANVGLMIAGFLLLLTQLHGYQHSVYPEDFPLSPHAHQHLHEAMKEN